MLIVSAQIPAEKRWDFSWESIRLSAPTFNPYPHVKQHQRTKINKTMYSAPSLPPHRFPIQRLHYQNWNANKYSILTVNELGPPVLKSSARISKFYAPTDSKRKFNKTEMENGLPIGYNLGSSWLGTPQS